MLFYDTELGYTIAGAWGLRKLRSSGYTGAVVRIRDTNDNSEQDVGFDPTTGELASFTVVGNAAVTTIYDQSGNGHHLVQTSSGSQPLLKLNITGNGKPAIEFDGVDDFMVDSQAAATSGAYLVSSPIVVGMFGAKLPREQWGKFWCIPHQDGANSSPYSRFCVEYDGGGSGDTLYDEFQARIDSESRILRAKGWNSRQGWVAHSAIPHLGVFLQAGVPAETYTTDSTTTYPNNTRLYLGSNGQGTENNGMYFSELVFMSGTAVEADVQVFIDQVGWDRLIGPNRFYRLTTTGSFDTVQTDAGFAELELRATAGGADLTAYDTPFVANKFATGERWEKGIDDNASTFFSSGNSPSSAPVQWIMLNQNTVVNEVRILARPDSPWFRYTVKKYILARFMSDGTWEDAPEIDNTADGNSAGQSYVDTIAWPTVTISDTYGFSYEIEPPLASSLFGFSYAIEVGALESLFGFSYDVEGPIVFTYGFSYAIELKALFGFRWKIEEPEGDLLGYRHIIPGVTASTKRTFATTVSATTLDTGSGNDGYGALTYPDVITQDPVDSAIHKTFYGDYYDRIWVSPEDLRLSNPKIGFEYEFGVWNAYDRPNDLIDYIGTNVEGVEFVEEGDLPITFAPIEFRTMHFLINSEAPSQIDGNLFFDFTMGGDGFDLFALVLGVLRTLPNEPLTEVWSWFTVIETARDGTEQRQAFRDQPRTIASYTVQILDEEDRQTAYQQLYSFATRSVIVPFMQYTTPLDADAALGDTRLYFDLVASDVRPGEYVVLFSPSTAQYVLAQISTLNADGVNLVTPLTFDVNSETWEVLPGRSMRLPNRSALGMGAVNGTMSFKGESTEWRDLVRPSGEVTLDLFDGYPVLPYKPIAQSDIEEAFTSDVEVIDNDVAPPLQRSSFTNPFVESTKAWLIDRETEMDWWRTFFDYCSGMLKPFLLPTWRDDLPLYDAPEVGDNKFITTSTDYADYFQYTTYQYVQIQSDAGVIYRKVESIEVVPEGLRVSLDDTIGLTVGSNVNMVVSFLNLTRLNSDDIELGHYVNWTIVSLDVRTVNG